MVVGERFECLREEEDQVLEEGECAGKSPPRLRFEDSQSTSQRMVMQSRP